MGTGVSGTVSSPLCKEKQFWDALCLLPQRGPVGLTVFPVTRSVTHLWGLFSFLLSFFSLTPTSGVYPHPTETTCSQALFLDSALGEPRLSTNPDWPLFWLRRLYQVLLRDPSFLNCKMKRTESASTDCRKVEKR